MALYQIDCDDAFINDEDFWNLILEAICSFLPEQFRNFIRREVFIMIENDAKEAFAVSFKLRGIRCIAINGDLFKKQPIIFVKALFHEIAHICLGHLDRQKNQIMKWQTNNPKLEWQARNLVSEWINLIGWGKIKKRLDDFLKESKFNDLMKRAENLKK